MKHQQAEYSELYGFELKWKREATVVCYAVIKCFSSYTGRLGQLRVAFGGMKRPVASRAAGKTATLKPRL